MAAVENCKNSSLEGSQVSLDQVDPLRLLFDIFPDSRVGFSKKDARSPFSSYATTLFVNGKNFVGTGEFLQSFC